LENFLFLPASIRSRLHSLCDGDPEEALLAIKDFFGVSDFKEGKRENSLKAGPLNQAQTLTLPNNKIYIPDYSIPPSLLLCIH
jgi:hypothetical protein